MPAVEPSATLPDLPRPRDIGTRHPLVVQATAADGGWVALCQARHDTDGDGTIAVSIGPRGALGGDALSLMLVHGAGAGEPIERMVAADPTGRYLVFEREGRVVLRDAQLRIDTDLSEHGAVVETDQSSFAPHRAASFSPDGARLIYLRRAGYRERVIVRTLADGAEVSIDPGSGLLWRAEFDVTGRWVVMKVVQADTNQNGRWEWPVAAEREAPPACASPIPLYRAWRWPGDSPVVRVASLDGTLVRQAPGFLVGSGSGWVSRSPDRGLFLDVPGQPRQLISASRCNGRIHHSAPVRGLLVVGCSTDTDPNTAQRELELVGVGTQRSLGVQLGPFEIDRVSSRPARLVPLYPGLEASVVDLDTGELFPLERRDRVMGTSAMSVLVKRRGKLWLGDVREHLAPVGKLTELSPVIHQAPMVLVPPWVVDLDKADVVGSVDRHALALANTGAVLVARNAGDARGLPVGPLSWVRPTPPR